MLFQVVSLRRSRTYSVQHIAAPIFDAQGGVVLELVLTDLPDRISASRIEARVRHRADYPLAGRRGQRLA